MGRLFWVQTGPTPDVLDRGHEEISACIFAPQKHCAPMELNYRQKCGEYLEVNSRLAIPGR